MQVNCPNCGQLISDDDLNEQTMIAVCPHCSEVFDFSDMVDAQPGTERLITPPQNVNVQVGDDRVTISYSWFGWRAPVFLAFGLLIFGVPFLLLNAIGGENQSVGVPAFIIFLFFAVFGVILTYYSLAQFMNTTHIIINGEMLVIRHAPIPMPGNVRVLRQDIIQLHRYERFRDTDYGEVHAYDLHVELQDGSQRPLVRGLKDAEQARFLDYQLRRSLHLHR